MSYSEMISGCEGRYFYVRIYLWKDNRKRAGELDIQAVVKDKDKKIKENSEK